MSFIFSDWKAFILDSLEISKKRVTLDETVAKEIIYKSVEIKEKLENRVFEYMLGKTKCREKKQYIKLLEIIVINLLDTIYSNKPGSNNATDNLIINAISEHLKAFLVFLEENFTDYFDYRQKIPSVIFERRSKELSGLADLVNKAAASACTHSRYIVRFIVNSFKELCYKAVAPTYREINYHMEFARELLSAGTLSSEMKIKTTLFYFNYNHKDLCELIGNELLRAVSKQKTKSSRLLLLLTEQKKINHYPMNLGYFLYPQLPSLKDQLNEWINEEINFLQMEEIIPENDDSKTFVHVTFRGTEIYLLHKAFVDSGGTAGETYKSLFEKTASHLINNNQKGFSTESLQKNADKVDYQAKDNVKRFLQKMIRNIDSY